MSDDDKSIYDQLICNQRVVTYKKIRGMNSMNLSSPWADSLDIIAFCPVKNARDEINGH